MFSIYLLDSSKLFQWDLNRKIKIIGKEDVDEVHFSHVGDEEALVVKPIKENNILIANIPNILLQESKDIFVYLVYKDKTLKETFFTVGRREKPTDYLYTEIDILNYSSLEKRLAELEEKLNNISVEETDPTVPDWAKQPNKPRYTASEVGALSSTETVRQLAQKQDKSNLVTSINASSADSTYPSTRAVYEYVGEEFARLIGSAPDALNTIEELANAFSNNQDVLDALNASIINKQDKADSVGIKTTQGGEIFNNYNNNIASALYAHAEGESTESSGIASHSEGTGTIANANAQHVQGKYNVEDTENKYAHIVGGGSSNTDRKNIHTLDWEGNAEYAGDVIANGCSEENPISLKELSKTVENIRTEYGQISDWNQNDKTANDYIKNRTHYESDSLTTVMDSTTVKINSNQTTGYILYNSLGLPSLADFKNFNKKYNYNVIFNGEEYNNLPVVNRLTYNCLGNLALSSSDYADTGEPFLIVDMPSAYRVYLYFRDQLDACTLSIFAKDDIVKIPSKFMNFDYVESIKSNPFTSEIGENAFEFGSNTSALGRASMTTGSENTANGKDSIASGLRTEANAHASSTFGLETIANGAYQVVSGRYNVEDTYDEESKGYNPSKYAEIVGNGTSDTKRSNARTLDWEGNAEYQGDVVARGCGGENPISLVETANDLNNKITAPLIASIGQILEVEEVDENGKPTKWKTVDKPEVVTTTTNDKGKVVTVDSEGNKILEYPSMISYKYADKIQESNTGVLFCFDTAKPNLGLFSMPNKITTFRVYKDGVYIQGADLKTYNAFIELNVIDCNETRIFVIGKLTSDKVICYFYYFSSNEWSIKTQMLPVESLENMFIQRPDEAEVGQILVVKAVDENGKPIEWETIDAPTGSGGDGYSPIAIVEQTETGATISIQDKNGTTTAVVNHGEDGKDGKTPYIDEEGFVVCGETPKNKTLLGEVVVTGHRKIQPLSIDYATGVITVDDCSFLSDSVISAYNTNVCLRKKTDKVYKLNTTPKELDGLNFIGIKKLSDNTLQLLKGSTGSEIVSYTEDAENHDINSWWIEYNQTPIKTLKIDLSEINNIKELEIEFILSDGYGNGCDIEYYNSNKERYGTTYSVGDSNYNIGLAFDGTRYLTPVNCLRTGFPIIFKHHVKIGQYITVDKELTYNVVKNTGDRNNLPQRYKINSSSILVNNGINSISIYPQNYGMLPEGSYIKVWEVHD